MAEYVVIQRFDGESRGRRVRFVPGQVIDDRNYDVEQLELFGLNVVENTPAIEALLDAFNEQYGARDTSQPLISSLLAGGIIPFGTPTKGSVFVGDGDQWVPFGVGADGNVLTAASAQPQGVTWATASSYVGQQVIYVGKHGSNANTGLSLAQAKLTFSAAVATAVAATPTPTNRFVVYCEDSGEYNEAVVCAQYVDIHAPNAKLTFASTVVLSGTLTLAPDSSVVIREVEQTGSPATCAVVYPNVAGAGKIEADIIRGTSLQNIVAINLAFSTLGVMMLEANQVFVPESGFGIGDASSATGHTHIEIEDLYLNGDNAIGISRFGAGSTVGWLSHIVEIGAFANTLAINIPGGEVDVVVDNITADTAWNVGAAGTLRLLVGATTGARVETGAVFVTEKGLTALHGATHENGGLDEIDVTGLSGLLGDAQTPLAHAATHENGGLDEIDVTGLSGLLGDAQTPLAHDHGSPQHTGLTDDDHTQYLLLAGRAGGQFAFGGTGAGEELELRGTTNANLGQIRCYSPIDFEDTSAANALNAYQVQANFTQAVSAAFIGGGVNISPDITFSNPVFIWEALRGSPIMRADSGIAFAAFTLFQALPAFRCVNPNTDLLQALVLNAAPAGTAEAGQTLAWSSVIGVNFSPTLRTEAAGGSLTATTISGITVFPRFNTVASSSVNFGTIRAVDCQVPAVAFLGSALGTESMVAYYGIHYRNQTFGGNVPKAAVFCEQAAASNAYCIRHTGSAQSVFGGNVWVTADIFGYALGAGNDFLQAWGAAGFMFWQFNASGDQLRWSNPSALRFLLTGATASTTELNLDCARFSLGAQTGAVGNQVGVFVTPARTTIVNGGWSDFLLTQAANLTINNAMTEINAWTVNPVALTSGTGSITGEVANLRIGGMTVSTLGGADTSAIYVTGRVHQNGASQYEPINPANLTGTVSAWAGLLTGSQNNASRYWARITCDAATQLAGIDATAVQDGDTYEVCNVGANSLQINHQDAANEATAANRIITQTGANITLAADEWAKLTYDSTTARWRVRKF